MVPTIRPSPKTSIFAPTRCGVEPVVDTIVTSAACSPRSSASATAAKTSRFMSLVKFAHFGRFRTRQKCLVHGLRAAGRGELAGLRVDVRERDAFGRLERHA